MAIPNLCKCINNASIRSQLQSYIININRNISRPAAGIEIHIQHNKRNIGGMRSYQQIIEIKVNLRIGCYYLVIVIIFTEAPTL